ncbi:MAG TPA: hypothetical protein VMT51_06525 [Dongiaceae bacterium]|nr:hypothetical protein [Dongiaceae bacterium]
MKAVRNKMTCEEFERSGLDLDRRDVDPQEAALAANHAALCGRCRALLESWREVKGDLQLLREETVRATAPMRVEMRLKQELRTRREERVPRKSAALTAWALAAAAVLLASVGWIKTHGGGGKVSSGANAAARTTGAEETIVAQNTSRTLLAQDFDSGEFTRLPGAIQGASGADAVLQVRMQRGGLQRFGLSVEQDRATDWVNVDFLLGEDGQPQAVRLHQDVQESAVAQ